MAYTLEEARTALKGRLLWLSNLIVREPLEGLVDGANKVFHLPYAPAQTDSVVVYDNSGVAVATTAYTISEEGGSVVFSTAISTAYTASYTYQSLTDAKLLTMCYNGFDIMQRMYPRSLYIVSSGSAYISSTSASVVDPDLGNVNFGDSRIQQGFLATCSEVALLNALIQRAGLEALDIREGITGMRIDRTKRVPALMSILDEAKARAIDEADIAADEAGDTTSVFEGSITPGAKSDTWTDWFDWYADSEQDRGVIA